MYSKKLKTPTKVQKPSIDIKSHTPSKVMIKSRIQSSRPLNSSFSSSKSSTLRDSSFEPLRMSIKLEDIIKSGSNQNKSINLKPELIEPEIESSIPCIEYAPKSVSNQVSKLSKTLEMYPEVSRPYNKIDEFSLDKMNDECKDFEQNLLTEDKVLIEDIEKYMKTQFNSRVKLKLEAKPRVLPSTVLVKTSKGYEYYNIIKY